MWKRWKILQKYLEHCWKECVSLLKVLCRMLIELGHSICQSWFWERAKHRDTENVKNETRSARYLLREHWGASVFWKMGEKTKTQKESLSLLSANFWTDAVTDGCIFVLIQNTKRACWGHILQPNIWNIAIGNWTKQRWRVFFPSVNCRRGAAAAGGEMQCNALARDRVLLALRWIAMEMH